MHYKFYFDETFHDKKITINSKGVINTFTQDKNDSYVGVFFGINNYQRVSVLKKMNKIEKKFIQKLDLKKEFKSTIFHRKNFNYGIRSFQKNTLDFYNDYFDMLNEISPIIHVNVLSKIEWLIRNIFDLNTVLQLGYVSSNVFYYSLTKFIIYYHTPTLTKSLYESIASNKPNIFKNELLNHLQKVIESIYNIERKERELPILQQLYYIIDNIEFDIDIHEKYDFIYFQNFEGLMKLLNELQISINKVNLTIDKEDETFQSAKEYPFHKVKQVDSTNSIQIRIADHLCGFIGRMMYAIFNDASIKEDAINDIELLEENNLKNKHFLSKEWFDLQLIHFELYKKVAEVLINKQNCYWATMTWSYGDQVSMFYSLIRYISTYKNYDDYKSISNVEHAEYYNTNCCADLERHYNEFNYLDI